LFKYYIFINLNDDDDDYLCSVTEEEALEALKKLSCKEELRDALLKAINVVFHN